MCAAFLTDLSHGQKFLWLTEASVQRWLKVPSQPHNNLLVSILNIFGLPNTTFGHRDYCTGPLSGLA